MSLKNLLKLKKDKLQPEVVVESPVDRSAYNCSSCNGDGLVGDVRCSQCNGTGKSEGLRTQFEEGSMVLTQEGQFRVKNGVLVKEGK